MSGITNILNWLTMNNYYIAETLPNLIGCLMLIVK